MASNGLVANPTKTTFIVFNNNRKKDDPPLEINIGEAKVAQESSAKLLGVKIEKIQQWNEQVSGTGGVIKSLNKRNNAPECIKNAKSLYSAKCEIKKYCASLPM